MTVDVSLRADRRDLLNDEDWGWWRPGRVGDDAEGQVSIAVRRQGVAVCPLRFLHYLQQLATGKFGERWRVSSRGVVAIAGSGVRMSFTQYPRHVDKSRAGEWQLMACRGVEVDVSLATGSALGSTLLCDEWLKASCQRITDGLEACLVPVTPTGVPCWPLPGASASDAGRAATWEAPPPLPVALVDTVPMLFYHLVVEYLTTREAVLLACTCSCLAEALLGESAGEELRLAGTAALAASLAASSSTSNGEDASQAPCTMLHPREDPTFAKLHVHGLLPLRAVATYVTAFAATRLCIVPDSGLVFFDAADAEAAGVAWLDLLARERREDPTGGCAPLQVGGELNHSGAGAGVNADGAANAGLASSSPHHFVVDFTWRPHILEHFFSACGQSTYSALARVEIPAGAEFFSDSDALRRDGDPWLDHADSFKFRMLIWPEPSAVSVAVEGAAEGEDLAASHPDTPAAYRLGFQLVGGRSSSRAYHISLHTVDLTQPVHVSVPDYRVPYVTSQEILGRNHPLVVALRKKHRVRTLVRMQSMGKA